MTNTNWYPISYRFEIIADYCSNFGHFAFLIPFRGLGATYAVHIRLIGKLVVDFLFVLIKPFSVGVTAKALRPNIDWKSASSLQQGQFAPKFQIEGSPPLVCYQSYTQSRCCFTTKRWAWSLPVTWQRWRSNYSIRHGQKTPAIRKLHGSIFYRTGVIADWIFTLRE